MIIYSLLLGENDKEKIKIIDFIGTIKEKEKNELQRASGDYKKAIKRAIKSWVSLKFCSLEEIKGVFEKNEVMAVVDMQNIFPFHAKLLKQHPKDVLLDSFSDENPILSELIEKWNLDLEQIRAKIDSLTYAQSFFLIEFCHLLSYDQRRDIEKCVSCKLEDDSGDQ